MDQSLENIGSVQDKDLRKECNAIVTPLQKYSLEGELYTRSPDVEALIAELATAPREELIARARIVDKEDEQFVPSECLVYFVRASRLDKNDAMFERLYKILIERVLRLARKGCNPDAKTESVRDEAVRDYIYSRFVELLSEDRLGYVDKLDFFEVRFNSAVACLRVDALRMAGKDDNRFQPLEYSDDTHELSLQVERAAGAFEIPDAFDLDDPNYRSRFEEAIKSLPPDQARIIHMMRKGFPIDSKDPNVMTIAKALKRCEKTVRTYRDKAYATLRIAMANGEER